MQATIDLLSERLEEARRAAEQRGGVLQAHGDQITMVEPSQEDCEARIQRSSALLEWCRQNVRILSTERLNGGEEALAVLSRSVVDTLGTLIEMKLVAIIDDRRLRLAASQLGAVKTGWTQALLQRFLAEEKISRRTYAILCSRLKASNVGFVSISGADLCAAIDCDEDAVFDELIQALSVATVEVRSLVTVAFDFMIVLWADPRYVSRRDRLTGSVFDILMRRHDWLDIVHAIAVLVYRRLNRRPFPQNHMAKLWLDYVERFAVGHFITRALHEKGKIGQPN